MEKPSPATQQWPLTGMQQPWNYLELVLFWGETTKFSESGMGLGGQLCVGVAFCSLLF